MISRFERAKVRRHTVFCGDGLASVALPDDAEIIRARPPLRALSNWQAALRSALEAPIGYPPLSDLVKPSHFVTIAFDDPCLPIPLMRRDVRAAVAEYLTERLLALGVKEERIRFVCANGLHRKWTSAELSAILGRRILSRFRYGEKLICHDAEDRSSLRHLGTTDQGEIVEINKAVTDSDLMFYISLVWTSMNGGWKSTAVGLGSYRSIACHHNPTALLSGGSLVEPHSSAMHQSIQRIGRLIGNHSRIVQIEIVLNTRNWAGLLTPLFDLDGKGGAFAEVAAHLLPQPLWRLFGRRLRSRYEPVAIHAGRVEEVHEKSLATLYLQQNVPVGHQFDVAIVGLADMSPYSAFSRMNPLLVMNLGLGYVFNLHRGRPLVRRGGVMVLVNPVRAGFHRKHHLPYIDFFEQVLPQTLDPFEMRSRFEPTFAASPRYVEAYRHRFCYHGSHPFFAWYWGARAMAHLGMVVLANAKEPKIVRRMGFTPATDVSQALAMAADLVGRKPNVALLRIPPLFAAEPA